MSLSVMADQKSRAVIKNQTRMTTKPGCHGEPKAAARASVKNHTETVLWNFAEKMAIRNPFLLLLVLCQFYECVAFMLKTL